MLEIAAFVAALSLASIGAIANGDRALTRTAVVLSGNWLACMGAVICAGAKDPWTAFIIIDAISAYVVLLHPASKPQAIIGCIYVIQITVHVAYAWVGHGQATPLYLAMLTGGGWLQIATLATGAINGSGRRLGTNRGMGGARSHPARSDSTRMETRK